LDAGPNESTKRSGVKRVMPWVRVVVAIALISILWLLANVKFAKVAEELRNVSLLPVLFVAALGFCGMLVSTLKLRIIATALGHDIPLSKLLRATYVGMFFNNFLPTSIGGDVFKIHEMRSESVPLSAVTSMVIAERACGVAAILLIDLCVALAWPAMLTRLGLDAWRWPLVGAFGGVMVAGMVTLLLWRGWLEPIVGRHRERRIRGAFHRIVSGLDDFVRRPRALLATLAVSILFYVVMGMLLLSGVHAIGFEIHPTEALAIPPLARLPEIVPISVAALGIREGARVWCLTHVGLPRASAIAVAALLRLVGYLHAAAGGILYARARRQTGH